MGHGQESHDCRGSGTDLVECLRGLDRLPVTTGVRSIARGQPVASPSPDVSGGPEFLAILMSGDTVPSDRIARHRGPQDLAMR